MALLNPSFEDAGTLPGEADHWTLTSKTSLQEIAGFGSTPEEAWEDFERWFDLLASLDDVTVVLAFFDSAFKGFEAFESGWDNAVFLYDLPPAQLVAAQIETLWSNVSFARAWPDVASVAGMFNGKPHEDFELQADAWSWSSPPLVEDFESAWTRATTQ
jgi:hypothetical protein